MRAETIAIHCGFDADPATKAVAVPIYQTAAYAFDSADHGAALFNLEEEGFRYSRINNPTVAVLEKRVAELEGGVAAIAAASGQAALVYALCQCRRRWWQYRLHLPALRHHPHTFWRIFCRARASTGRSPTVDSAAEMATLIDENTRALFCETVGNPAGNICDIEAIAKVAHDHGVPLIVDNTVATPILQRPIEHGADIVVHSLTKFLGGHGSAMGGIVVDGGTFDWKAHAERFPQFTQPDESYHGLVYAEHYGRGAFTGRIRSVLPARHRRHPVADERFPHAAGHRDGGAAHRAACREWPGRGGISARRSQCRVGAICRLPGQPLSRAGGRNIWMARCRRFSLLASRAASKPARISMTR